MQPLLPEFLGQPIETALRFYDRLPKSADRSNDIVHRGQIKEDATLERSPETPAAEKPPWE
jgi:hypothetical protein